MHRTLAAEELENLIHGDAAHLFEGFFGERADMRRKEHIRQGGEGAWDEGGSCEKASSTAPLIWRAVRAS